MCLNFLMHLCYLTSRKSGLGELCLVWTSVEYVRFWSEQSKHSSPTTTVSDMGIWPKQGQSELTSEVLWKLPENKLYFNIIWEESLGLLEAAGGERTQGQKKKGKKERKEPGDGKTFLITWKYKAHQHATSQLD